MRIAIFSDAHGNLAALEAVLADIQQKTPDLTVFAGDLCLFGARPAACIDRLQAEDISSLHGNTDMALNNQPLLSDDIQQEKQARRQHIDDIVDWTWAQLNADQRAWLRTLPFQRRVSPTPHPKDDLFIVHANPKDDQYPIFASESRQKEIYDEVKQADSDPDLRHVLKDLVCGVLAFGHVHVPSIRRWQDTVLVNISSVSLAQDRDNRAKYGLLTWHKNGWEIEHQYVPYAVDEEVALLAESRPPGWESISQRLQHAHP